MRSRLRHKKRYLTNVNKKLIMELEDKLIYNSNVAYHAHEEFIQRQDCNKEMTPTEASSDRTSNNKPLNEFKSESLKIEFIKIKKILIAMILLGAVLVATTLTATIFSMLSYRMSKLDDDSDNRILHNTIAQSYCGAGQ